MKNEIVLNLNVKESHYSECSGRGCADYSVTALKGAQEVAHRITNLKDLIVARKMKQPYPTEGVTYVFDFDGERGEPCKITDFEVDNHSILHYTVQLVEGEDFEVSMPVDSLDKETISKIYVGNTVYVSLSYDD